MTSIAGAHGRWTTGEETQRHATDTEKTVVRHVRLHREQRTATTPPPRGGSGPAGRKAHGFGAVEAWPGMRRGGSSFNQPRIERCGASFVGLRVDATVMSGDLWRFHPWKEKSGFGRTPEPGVRRHRVCMHPGPLSGGPRRAADDVAAIPSADIERGGDLRPKADRAGLVPASPR
jgi:hypothetical protein